MTTAYWRLSTWLSSQMQLWNATPHSCPWTGRIHRQDKTNGSHHLGLLKGIWLHSTSTSLSQDWPLRHKGTEIQMDPVIPVREEPAGHSWWFCIRQSTSSQRSTLRDSAGPLLFLLIINDLLDCVKAKTRLFADDCIIHTMPKWLPSATRWS